jgi:hypothetical protein
MNLYYAIIVLARFLLLSLHLCQADSKTPTIQHYSVRFQELNNEAIHPSSKIDNANDSSPTNKAVVATVSAVLAIIAALICAACIHLVRSFQKVSCDAEHSKSSIGPFSKSSIGPLSKTSIGPISSSATTVKHVNRHCHIQGTISSLSVACDQTLDDSTIYTSSCVSNIMIPDVEGQILSTRPKKKEENDLKERVQSHNCDGNSVATYLETIKKAYHDLSSQNSRKESFHEFDETSNNLSSSDESSADYLSGGTGLKCIKIIHFDKDVEPSLLSVYSMDQFYPNSDEINTSREKKHSKDDENYDSFSSIDVESVNLDKVQTAILSQNSSYSCSEGEI